ncbi:uncharacterized beta-barrel protein YwiB (DUF1934 family) [Staphylococcus auricularis]|uniref:DUF1934 domain-containing protein n=1 Tax=Staphylococcus auricularis TaxID=29379 RepID=A0AAP8TTR0_9STAP|nr:DUF1934 family protein [Staphylococcus auricularis]MBM0867460.1 DUF1934 family protein [Staphylococcus auricularis]MCE5038512.1 DUF1934 family protein [Staphylococcus auricularis]MCG7341562.1 DUF1934 family protein [Staphylococcus auricularis]MDC6327729.1 DUF1934 family protein [Staphylococcus auricularis]MDN4533681.1 DUF1934 family protein [Staphylococcus auricularis]
MENNVQLQIKQTVKQFDDKQKFMNRTEGVWQQREAEFIRYQEQVEEAHVNVTVKIESSGVKIIRKGDINMKLHFVEGEDTVTLYELSGAKIPLTVRTRSIKHFVEADGGKLKVHYDLLQAEEKMGTYQYEINYKEIE